MCAGWQAGRAIENGLGALLLSWVARTELVFPRGNTRYLLAG